VRLGGLALGVLLLSGVARAQPATSASPADIAQARELFTRGVELLRERRWSEGCEVLERSNALVETAQTHHNLAVCTGELGRLLDQAEHLRAFLRLAGPSVDRSLVDRAQADLEAVTPQIPSIVLAVEPPDARGVEVSVDGEAVSASAWGTPRPVNPGEVVVVAGGDDWFLFNERYELRRGEQRTIDIRLRRRPTLAASDPAPAPEAPPDGGGDDVGVWIAVSAIAAVVLGAVAVTTYFLVTAGDDRSEVPLDVDWRAEALLRF